VSDYLEEKGRQYSFITEKFVEDVEMIAGLIEESVVVP
jgi:hypothetical protein